MRNLAGNPNCDEYILRELRRARIDAIPGDRATGEVAASFTGQLGPFLFRRAWYYWVAEGPLPVEAARELYADPVGADDVRVNGNAGCPPPGGHNVRWVDDRGRGVYSLDQKFEVERFLESASPDLRKFAVDLLADNAFAEDPSATGRGFVDLYHIDSEVGLRLFADAIRKHVLDRAAEARSLQVLHDVAEKAAGEPKP